MTVLSDVLRDVVQPQILTLLASVDVAAVVGYPGVLCRNGLHS